MIPKIINNENIPSNKIIGEVLFTNEASNKIFVSCGYNKIIGDTENVFVEYLK